MYGDVIIGLKPSLKSLCELLEHFWLHPEVHPLEAIKMELNFGKGWYIKYDRDEKRGSKEFSVYHIKKPDEVFRYKYPAEVCKHILKAEDDYWEKRHEEAMRLSKINEEYQQKLADEKEEVQDAS